MNLEKYKWKSRVLFVSTPNYKDKIYLEVKKIYQDKIKDFHKRYVKLICKINKKQKSSINLIGFDGKKINKKQVYDLNGRIVIGLLHNGKNCKKDEIDFVKSHNITGRFCEFRNNTPLENLEAVMGDIFIKLAR